MVHFEPVNEGMKMRGMMRRKKWFQARGSVWAVFDQRGVPWLVSMSKHRGGAIRQYLKDGRFRGRYANWLYWTRAGYTVRRMKLRMMLQ